MKNPKENEDCGCTNAAATNPAATGESSSAGENPVTTIQAKFAEPTPAQEAKSLQPKSLLASDSVTYTYDSRGRLNTVTFQNGTVVTYSYDACGNRTSVVTTCPGGTC
jgi:YD repeat-containing protein